MRSGAGADFSERFRFECEVLELYWYSNAQNQLRSAFLNEEGKKCVISKMLLTINDDVNQSNTQFVIQDDDTQRSTNLNLLFMFKLFFMSAFLSGDLGLCKM